jgi:glycosyltransferase involved in cell wall biosynthesis
MSSSSRAKVLLLIPHLGGGGAEHVAETLARSLSRRKYEVHLGLVTKVDCDLAEPSRIENIHKLNTSRIRHSSLKLLHLIWKLRPSVILSGMAHLNLLVLILRPALPRKTRVLIRQNGKLSATLATSPGPRLSRFLYGVAYRHADIVICQSESMKQEIQREFRVDDAKLAVLPNPVDSLHIRRAVEISDDDPIEFARYLLAIGRLVHEKGFDILLQAFSNLSSRFARTELTILGSGPCEASLKRQSEKLGITKRVHFPSHVSNPARYFRSTSLFVLSSRTEGIPNALLEAASAGLPIVATPASTGLVALLAKREGVWLARDVSAGSLGLVLETALSVIKPGQRCAHKWIEPFELAHAIPAYEAVIDRTIEDCNR